MGKLTLPGTTRVGPMGSKQRRPDVAYSLVHDELIVVYENFQNVKIKKILGILRIFVG